MSADQQLIEDFIRTRGVTVCPIAACAPTTADIPEDVRQFHATRDLGALDSLLVRKARETARKRAILGNRTNQRKFS